MDQIPTEWRSVGPTGDVGQDDAVESAASRRRVIAAAGIAGLLVVFAAAAWLALTAGSEREVSLEEQRPGASAGASARDELVVYLAGAVRRPGLYRLPVGSRVGDAIAAAGGFGPSVDAAASEQQLNLAAVLEDGAKIVVPERGIGATSPNGPAGAPSAAPGRLDLNRATQPELEELPGIGPVTAKKIIDAREETPFRTVDELRDRKLVGSSTFEKIRELVTVGG